jgi:hypothetical protein
MLKMSPSGALSPYHYKGGYFHGIHYGSFHDDADGLAEMMNAEEQFILRSPERRKIMIDFYETQITPAILVDFAAHIERISDRISKLGISADRKNLRRIRKALYDGCSLGKGLIYFSPDMEEAKTWLVSDLF